MDRPVSQHLDEDRATSNQEGETLAGRALQAVPGAGSKGFDPILRGRVTGPVTKSIEATGASAHSEPGGRVEAKWRVCRSFLDECAECPGRTICRDSTEYAILGTHRRLAVLADQGVSRVSVRQSFLAILDQGPCYGYQLRAEFERRTTAAWPVNIGQVYSTLDRLVRDGLVTRDDSGGTDPIYYSITRSGHDEVTAWLATPIVRPSGHTRDELAMKLAIAVTLEGVDVLAILAEQRASTLRTLNQLAQDRPTSADPQTAEALAGRLVADSLVFHAEAEVRWLERAEARVTRAAAHGLAEPVPIDGTPVRRGRPARGSAADPAPVAPPEPGAARAHREAAALHREAAPSHLGSAVEPRSAEVL